MRNARLMLIVGLLGFFGTTAAARDPMNEVKQLFPGQTVWVQDSDEPGGILLRMMNIDLREDAARQTFRKNIAAAQRVISVHELHLTHSGDREFGPGGLSFLAELKNLRLLSLGGSNFTQEDLKVLGECPELERLYISGEMGKAGFEGIAKARSLELIRAQYLRAEWEAFPALPKLLLLDAERSDLNDAGAAALASCPELNCVYAYSTQVTNKGLLELAKIKKLKFLGVSSGRIDEDGAAAFRKARPDVELLTAKPEPRAIPAPRGPIGPLTFLQRN